MPARYHHDLHDLLHLEGRTLALLAALLSMLAFSCRAEPMTAGAEQLYRAQTAVTGQGAANRLVGFAACLEDALIKVSATPKLAGDPRLTAIKEHARDYVASFSYHDQMSGTPTRDEQGTRDRPYDLTVDFEPAKIDRLLATLGLKPWASHRPVLAVFVEMQQDTRDYIVTSDARQSDLQRESLLAAAAKRGMRIALPTSAALTQSAITPVALPTLAPALLTSATQGGEIVLIGHLTWSDADLGWITDWRLDTQGKPQRWRVRGVTFDEAFRRGIGGAAQLLSGNGTPD